MDTTHNLKFPTKGNSLLVKYCKKHNLDLNYFGVQTINTREINNVTYTRTVDTYTVQCGRRTATILISTNQTYFKIIAKGGITINATKITQRDLVEALNQWVYCKSKER